MYPNIPNWQPGNMAALVDANEEAEVLDVVPEAVVETRPRRSTCGLFECGICLCPVVGSATGSCAHHFCYICASLFPARVLGGGRDRALLT